MTFRARPTTRTGRRSGYESDARRNLYFNLGFGAVVVVAILLLVGRGRRQLVRRAHGRRRGGQRRDRSRRTPCASASPSRRSGSTRWSRGPARRCNAGKMSPSQGQQLLTYISQQKEQVGSLAYEREIDTTLLLQLAPERGSRGDRRPRSTPRSTKDATTPESRHTYQIAVVPETSAGATEPTPAQKDAAKKKADGLLADLEGRQDLGGGRQGLRRRRRRRDERRPLLHRQGDHLPRRAVRGGDLRPRRAGLHGGDRGRRRHLPDRPHDRDLGASSWTRTT